MPDDKEWSDLKPLTKKELDILIRKWESILDPIINNEKSALYRT
jgi:hypothetical protein